jgi:hypothetical protein
MEVVDRDNQHDTLLQAVQNHGPQVVMVDEIGNKDVSLKPDWIGNLLIREIRPVSAFHCTYRRTCVQYAASRIGACQWWPPHMAWICHR